MAWIGVGIAGGAALAGGALSYFGNQQAANSAQSSAQAQLLAAQSVRSATMNIAGSSPQELNRIGQQYDAAMTNLQQQQQLMSSIDPALMEASKQALGILQGGTAATNNPLMAQRSAQRNQLVSSLQNQYGPGAESSSIGQQALQQFDMQTNSMFQQNQQNTLGQLTGIANSGGNEGALSSALGSVQNANSNYSNIIQRQIAASNGTAGPVIGAAGANSVAGGLQGQGLASLGGGLMSAGGGLGGAIAGGYARSGGLNTGAMGAYAGGGLGAMAGGGNGDVGASVGGRLGSTWGPVSGATGYGPVQQ